MSNSTVYDVKVRYALDDRASKGANGIASACDRAAQKAFSLRGALAMIGGVALFAKAKNSLIDFNSQIDQMKIGLSTVMQMQLHMPLVKANEEASKLFQKFQELAKQSPATTKDFMDMANAIAPGIGLAGGGPEKILKLTQGAVLASIALGERADMVALDIKQMLAGTVTAKDRTAQQLLGGMGIKAEDFNAMSARERAEVTERAFTQQPLLDAGKAMGESFAGQTAALKDNLQIALGQVGLPLMKEITKEVSQWNDWISKHPKLIASYVSDFGGMIKDAFGFVRDVTGWLVDNRELLFAIGKTFLVFKGAQIGTQVFKKFADGMGNLVASMKDAGSTIRGIFSGGATGGGVTGAFRGLVSVLSGAGGVIPALGFFAGALGILGELMYKHAEDDRKARNAAISLSEATGDIPDLMNRRKELEARLANPLLIGTHEQDRKELERVTSQLVDPEKLGLAIRKISESSAKHGGGSLKNLSLEDFQTAVRQLPSVYDHRNPETMILGSQAGTVLNLFNRLAVDQRREILKHAFPERWGDPISTPKPVLPDADWKDTPTTPEVNITIQRIEVASEDPDRFVFGLVKIGERALKHPTTSQHATPGGL